MASGFLDRVSNKALGELLVEKGTLSDVQVNEALEISRTKGIRLGEALVSLGYITRDALGYAIGEQYGLQPMELQPSMVDPQLVSRFDFDLLDAHTMLPLIEIGQNLVVVVPDPNNQQGLEELSHILPQYTITPQLGAAEQIRRCLEAVRPHLAADSATAGFAHGTEAHRPPHELSYFNEAPGVESPQFMEWLLSLAVLNPSHDVLLRDFAGQLQITLTPSTGRSGESQNTALTQVGLWETTCTSDIRRAILEQVTPLEFTREQAGLWNFPVAHESRIYDVLVLTPIAGSTATVRLRALEHLEYRDDEWSIPLSPSLEAGKYTVVLYDESVPLERALAQFMEEHAANHTFLVCQLATRCVFPHAQSYPAPFTNMVAAVQATAATCVIIDHPVEYREATRLLTSTYPPPAVLVCAPLPSHEAGAGSLSPDVEELITRQDAQSVRLDAQPESLTENTRGND